MLKLCDSSMSSLFCLPESLWTSINKRVGFILYLNKLSHTEGGRFIISWPDNNVIQLLNNLTAGSVNNPTSIGFEIFSNNDNKVPNPDGSINDFYLWNIEPNINNILPYSQLWQSTTFASLINLSSQIDIYASTSISTFEQLNNQLSSINESQLNAQLQADILTAIKDLNVRTNLLLGNVNNTMNNIRNLLIVNQEFDGFLTSNSALFSLLNVEQFETGTINIFEANVEKVLGIWNAISNDLAETLSENIVVSMPFVEGLNLNEAILEWENIQIEVKNFTAFAGNQSQYWNYQA